MRLHLDFETRSECDLDAAGAYVYARHPTTRVLCAAWAIGEGQVRHWDARDNVAVPHALWDALEDPEVEVHAWNAQFERLILCHVLGIEVPLERFRCTAALARARGLPGKLETALDFLGESPDLAVKRKGTALMMRWSQPLKTGGWADSDAEFKDLLDYCRGDVRSERLIGRQLEPLSAVEQSEYLLTEIINDRGLPIDRDLAQAAASYGDVEKRELSAVLHWATGEELTSVNQHARIKAWLHRVLGEEVFARHFVTRLKDRDKNDVARVSTDANARTAFLDSEDGINADPDVVMILEMINDAGKASVSKYTKMAARTSDGHRAEGSYLCWGAGQTKRYSSRGVQVHNLPRNTPSDLQAAVKGVLAHDVPGQTMHVLASLLRPCIKARPGKVLVWGDWASVEARGMPWLAGAKAKLNLYRKGIDVYRVNAHDIFNCAPEAATDDQRQTGKVAELSLQFGGGEGALRRMAAKFGIRLPNPIHVVKVWRKANQWATNYSQGLLEAFLKTALGMDSRHGKIGYRQIAPLLPGTVSIACDLPGGTTLYYHGVVGEVMVVPANGKGSPHRLKAMHGKRPKGHEYHGQELDAYNSKLTFTKTLPSGFRPDTPIWHGLFAENTTQAICAALLRDCVERVNVALPAGAEVIGHTHDEIILECDTSVAAAAEEVLRHEMRRVPKWLPGFPLDCSVKCSERYGK